ncbi:MAG: hypothetical protein WCO86_10610 [Planctomycetota bacterium]
MQNLRLRRLCRWLQLLLGAVIIDPHQLPLFCAMLAIMDQRWRSVAA